MNLPVIHDLTTMYDRQTKQGGMDASKAVYLGNGESLKERLQAHRLEGPWLDISQYSPEPPQSFSADNDISKIWGNVEVNGKIVAQIFEGGMVTTESQFTLPDREVQGAYARAQSMLKAYGGTLVMRNDMKNPELFCG